MGEWQRPPQTATGARTETRGRKTREEEVYAYLRQHDIDPEALFGEADGDAEGRDVGFVPGDEQMFEEFRTELYRRRREMNDTALVAGLKSLALLAAAAKAANVDEAEDVREVSEILADAGLPAERRVELGRQEVARLAEQTRALELVVASIEGEV